LRDPAFVPFSTALVHDGPLEPTSGGSVSGVGVRERRPGEVVVATEGDGSAWLVFSEMYYPGWHATVDGAPVPVRRADVALMAVPVPAGSHTVRLWFTAPRVDQGLAMSVVALVVWLGLAIFEWRGAVEARPWRRRRAREVARAER
jgi:hypothetical protein